MKQYSYLTWCFCWLILLKTIFIEAKVENDLHSSHIYYGSHNISSKVMESDSMGVEFIHNLVYRIFPVEEEASFFLSQIKFTLYPTTFSPSAFHDGREYGWNAIVDVDRKNEDVHKPGKNLYLHTPTKDYAVPEYFTICPIDSREDSPQIAISANSKSALSQGTFTYIKDYLNQDASWGRDGTGNSLDLSAYTSSTIPKKNSRGSGQGMKRDGKKKSFPKPKECVKNTSPLPFRYYMNVCTVSYTMAFWDWKHWEKELDWMALSGINFALAFTGQEIIWLDLFEEFGISREDTLKTFLSGPAFFAWQRMGNLKSWGGPLPMDYVHQQADLQSKILGRMIELGINPILPAFAGFVPDTFSKAYPNASVTPSEEWNGFEAAFLLEPGDNADLFVSIGKRFIELQQERYGNILRLSSRQRQDNRKLYKNDFDYVQYYNTDTYNEMDPKSSDPEYLEASTKAVMDSIKAGDSNAKWIMQGWLFHSDFWTDQNIANYLKGVSDTDMIILDLNSEDQPLWPTFVKNNKPFIWCLLHNYGGRRALYGKLDHYALQPRMDFETASSNYMLGIGLTPEAIEQNPIVYELMLEIPWIISDNTKMTTYSDVPVWINKYVTRRYNLGNSSGLKKSILLQSKLDDAIKSIQEGWNLLHEGVYGNMTVNHYHLPTMAKQPDPYMDLDRETNATKLIFALESIVSGARNLVELYDDKKQSQLSVINGPFQYDLVDIGRQYIANLFSDLGVLTDAIYTDATENSLYKSENAPNRVQRILNFMLYMFDDLDLLLSTDVNYLLGPWIDDALYISNIHADKMHNPDRALFEFNARNQVTLWGPNGNIDDYASKQWAGLMKDYHKKRYEIYFRYLSDAIEEKTTLDKGTYHEELLKFGQKWCNDTSIHYPTNPTKEVTTLDVVTKLLNRYSPSNIIDEHYLMYEDTDLKGEDILQSLQEKTIVTFHGTDAPGKSFWTRDIRQLALICDLDSDCIGFNNNGTLYRGNEGGAKVHTEGLTSFLKK